MKFDRHFPTDKLKDYIKYHVVSENDVENQYKVFPSLGLVIGFRFLINSNGYEDVWYDSELKNI